MLRRWGWAAVFFLACTASAAPAEVLPLRGGTLRIAVVGDVGDGASTVEAGIARVHVAAPLDAVIIPGDNFYPCSVTSVTDARWSIITPLTTLGVPLYPVLGNHDYCGKPDAQVQATGTVPHWRMPARSYVVRNELADFAMLDTTPYARGRSRDAAEAAPPAGAADKQGGSVHLRARSPPGARGRPPAHARERRRLRSHPARGPPPLHPLPRRREAAGRLRRRGVDRDADDDHVLRHGRAGGGARVRVREIVAGCWLLVAGRTPRRK